MTLRRNKSLRTAYAYAVRSAGQLVHAVLKGKARGVFEPSVPETWLYNAISQRGDDIFFNYSPSTGDNTSLEKELNRFKNSLNTSVTLAVGSKGQNIYCNNSTSDKAYTHGANLKEAFAC